MTIKTICNDGRTFSGYIAKIQNGRDALDNAVSASIEQIINSNCDRINILLAHFTGKDHKPNATGKRIISFLRHAFNGQMQVKMNKAPQPTSSKVTAWVTIKRAKKYDNTLTGPDGVSHDVTSGPEMTVTDIIGSFSAFEKKSKATDKKKVKFTPAMLANIESVSDKFAMMDKSERMEAYTAMLTLTKSLCEMVGKKAPWEGADDGLLGEGPAQLGRKVA